MTGRAEFIERIRREVAKTPGLFGASTAPRPAHPATAALTVRRELAERWPEALDRFRVEFERVAGVFHRVPDLDAVPAVIGGLARERGIPRRSASTRPPRWPATASRSSRRARARRTRRPVSVTGSRRPGPRSG